MYLSTSTALKYFSLTVASRTSSDADVRRLLAYPKAPASATAMHSRTNGQHVGGVMHFSRACNHSFEDRR